MPIIGKIYALPNKDCIENMEVGGEGYLHINDIIITKSAIFVDTLSPVLSAEDLVSFKDVTCFIPVKRLGDGLTEVDFEIDFSNSFEYESVVNSKGLYINLASESEDYIIFYNFQLYLGVVNNMPNVLKRKLSLLRVKLGIAVKNSEFEEATRLRNNISKLRSKKK